MSYVVLNVVHLPTLDTHTNSTDIDTDEAMALRGGTASKRIVKELAEVAKDLPENIKAGQRNESNIFEWYAQIRGPPNSVYEGGELA